MNRKIYRIGIDGGGTKTRAVVVDENFQIVGAASGGSSNIHALGPQKITENILQSADLALQNAGLNREQISAWGLGLAGVSSSTESTLVESALRLPLGLEPRIRVVEDVVAAHRGAFPEIHPSNIQILCIAGTGANCFGRRGATQTAQSDGLGPLLGDRGSGYRIGEAALRLFGREADGVENPTDFSPAILEHFGARNTAQLIQIVYAPDFARARVASLVPLVVRFSTKNEGARQILESAGIELAQTARAVWEKLSPATKNEGFRAEVALEGGVLSGVGEVRNSFKRALGEGAELVEARFESAVGAALSV